MFSSSIWMNWTGGRGIVVEMDGTAGLVVESEESGILMLSEGGRRAEMESSVSVWISSWLICKSYSTWTSPSGDNGAMRAVEVDGNGSSVARVVSTGSWPDADRDDSASLSVVAGVGGLLLRRPPSTKTTF